MADNNETYREIAEMMQIITTAVKNVEDGNGDKTTMEEAVREMARHPQASPRAISGAVRLCLQTLPIENWSIGFMLDMEDEDNGVADAQTQFLGKWWSILMKVKDGSAVEKLYDTVKPAYTF